MASKKRKPGEIIKDVQRFLDKYVLTRLHGEAIDDMIEIFDKYKDE